MMPLIGSVSHLKPAFCQVDTKYVYINLLMSLVVELVQVWTSDPHYIKSILATDFDGYTKGKRLTYALASVLGSGIFNSDGDIWKYLSL